MSSTPDAAVTEGEPSPAPAPDAHGRAGRNLPVAIAVGLALAGAVVATLFTLRWTFVVLAGVAMAIAVDELARALRTRGVAVWRVPIVLGGAAMLTTAYLTGVDAFLVALLLTFVAVFVWGLVEAAAGGDAGAFARDLPANLLVTLYVPFLVAFAALMVAADDGPRRVVVVLATVICVDVGGYAVGVLFGSHRMAPSVSPKKSWEGFAGSVSACVLCAGLMVPLYLHGVWWQGVVLGLAIVVAATLGDLGESMIKRDLGIKDMGALLPGHGGAMDRLDSLLPSTAVAWMLLALFVPYATTW